jgi:hypothetical protein
MGVFARFQRWLWAVGIGALVWLGAAPSATALTNEVIVEWLVRGQPNPDPTALTLSLSGNESRVLEDVIRSGFGLERGRGAFRISSSADVVATCRIYATEDDGTYGQGFEAVPTAAATVAGTSTHVLGLSSTDDFRANLYAVAGVDGATVRLELIDPAGSQLAEAELSLGTHEPFLEPLTTVFPIEVVEQATLLVHVVTGSVVVGASKIDNMTSDPTTLTSWIPGAGDPLAAGSYFGVVAATDTAATGGLTLLLDGDARVVGIEFSYPAEACSTLLTAGQDLSDAPLPLAELATGHSFVTSYPGGGNVEWSLQLELQTAGTTLAGSLAANGSDWGGEFEACNGDHGPLPVALGSRQSSTSE